VEVVVTSVSKKDSGSVFGAAMIPQTDSQLHSEEGDTRYLISMSLDM
jgi:hypothetical protein